MWRTYHTARCSTLQLTRLVKQRGEQNIRQSVLRFKIMFHGFQETSTCWSRPFRLLQHNPGSGWRLLCWDCEGKAYAFLGQYFESPSVQVKHKNHSCAILRCFSIKHFKKNATSALIHNLESTVNHNINRLKTK